MGDRARLSHPWTPVVLVVALLTIVAAIPANANQSDTSGSTAAILFEDATVAAGVQYLGRSWGMSWSDFDGDGWTDVWVTNHMLPPSLFINQQDGTFAEFQDTLFDAAGGDIHGTAWADFDNDGDQDLLEINGGNADPQKGDNKFRVNDGTRLVLTEGSGIEATFARGRNPLWFDANLDGLLDVFETAAARNDGLADPMMLFLQTAPGTFVDTPFTTGPVPQGTSQIAQLGDLNGDMKVELAVHGQRWPQAIYEIGPIPMADLDVGLPQYAGDEASDVIIDDLDNDGLQDVVVVGLDDRSNWGLASDTDLRMSILTHPAEEHTITFETTGDVTFLLAGGWPVRDPVLEPDGVFIGETGWHPADTLFTLSPSDPLVEGILPHQSGVDGGAYVGFDPATSTWTVSCTDPATCKLDGVITSTATISNVTAIGFDPAGRSEAARIWMQNAGGGFTETTATAGLGGPNDYVSAVSGDFDNDQDLDLYFVATTRAMNTPNLLFENQGDGTFVEVAGAGGAAGTLAGKGDSVATADYDLDGYLDMWVTNGLGPEPLVNDGPTQVFRNLGGSNHWLQIDLQGVVSNRDGIGAVVTVEAGGVTQTRVYSGMHARSQNDPRLHFGLGANMSVDAVTVHWPNGTVQTVGDVAADQVIEIVEGEDPPAPLPYEVGTLSVGSSWQTVNLTGSFVDPVVVVGPAGSNDLEPLTIRVRDVTPTSFALRIEEWTYLADRTHPAEDVHYLVVERGVHTLADGTTVEAGSASVSNALSQVFFTGGFTAAPAVLSQPVTRNGFRPITTRVRFVGPMGFTVRVQEEERFLGSHPAETVHYIAWEEGSDPGAALPWQVLKSTVTDQTSTVAFDPVAGSACLLAGTNSFVERDPATLRFADPTAASVDVFFQEDQSRDAETTHASETLVLFRFDC